MQAENDLLEPVSTSQRPHSGYITVTVARFSQILAALFRVQLTARENEGRAVLYSSDPALIGTSANLVVAGLVAREGMTTFTFVRFLLWGFPLTLVALLISSAYVLLFQV